MSMNLDAVGTTWDVGEFDWSSRDALLYALGVGAGALDPMAELSFTTENSHEVTQQVLPTFAVLFIGQGEGPKLGDFDYSQVLHAEQGLRLHAPLQVDGRVRITQLVEGIYDKGSGALVSLLSSAFDVHTDALVAECTTGIFVRGEGGFGGGRGPSVPWTAPDRVADQVVVYPTRADQALVYRLSGDRNPLHSDPSLARRVGFERPILHGLCTYGFTGRALLHAVCGSDPTAFRGMSARFAASVFPGQELAVHIWDDDDGVRFVTKVGNTVVLDRGVFTKDQR